MATPSDLHSTTERVADSVFVKLVARFAMIIGVPLVGYLGNELWTSVKRTNESTIRLEEKITTLLNVQIPDMQRALTDRINAHAQRLDGQDRRNDRQDTDIDDLKRRVYPLTRTP